ncbi:MAG: hypothetical protein EOP06_28225 [Proteobacteria bacterium]|nr:MAG: hypothetical protein EOP06_28225 [Pseudomonadota bacterium]
MTAMQTGGSNMVAAQSGVATLLDWSQVRSGVEAFRASFNFSDDGKAFQYFSISKILKIDDDEIRTSITDGGDDRGIDAVYIESKSERKIIHLFQFKHVRNFDNSKNTFPSNEIDKILSFVENLLQKSDDIKSTCNPLLWNKVQDIWSALEESIHSIQIHLCTNASALTPSHTRRFEEALRPYQHATLKQHDLIWFSY